MSVQIRLARYGSRKSAFYRIVVTDGRNPRDGRFIESVGTVDPAFEPPRVSMDSARVEYWQGKGAKASATLTKLIKSLRSAPAAG
jgi:small subunit ribosomal protein S16